MNNLFFAFFLNNQFHFFLFCSTCPLVSPICSTEKTTYGVSTLEPIEVECKVNSVPPAHTFYWTLNSSAFTKPMNLHSFHNQIKGQMSIVS